MRFDRARKKKLVVAFHFQRANQAAWRCETCRKQGLEKKRACGWLDGNAEPNHVVWARKSVVTQSCPRSYIAPESVTWLEEFHVRKVFGFGNWQELPARTVDAFCVLERELAMERSDGHE